MLRTVLSLAFGLGIVLPTIKAASSCPDKIYGVNIGSWLVAEGWMFPEGWKAMGGEACSPCTKCIGSEFDIAKAYPHDVDAMFKNHWQTWFTKRDIYELKQLGINTARIPLGWWIVEGLVDRNTEFFPRGGLLELRRGLSELSEAGIVTVLNLHAAPGAQRPNEQWTGHCTEDVEFYTPKNYRRALTWAAVMTSLSHVDPAFNSVFSIGSANSPLPDAMQTPGYSEYVKNFVLVVRLIESVLGIDAQTPKIPKLSYGDKDIKFAFDDACKQDHVKEAYPVEVLEAVLDAIPILAEIITDIIQDDSCLKISNKVNRQPLVVSVLDAAAQKNTPSNPRDAAIGRAVFDHHLWFADDGSGKEVPATTDGWLAAICNSEVISDMAMLGNFPLWFGEWTLATSLGQAETEQFLRDYGDAQKLLYEKSLGWIYWAFKVEDTIGAVWSYSKAVEKGLLTRDPSKVFNKNVCKPYIGKSIGNKVHIDDLKAQKTLRNKKEDNNAGKLDDQKTANKQTADKKDKSTRRR